jgi:hypothetical protein
MNVIDTYSFLTNHIYKGDEYFCLLNDDDIRMKLNINSKVLDKFLSFNEYCLIIKLDGKDFLIDLFITIACIEENNLSSIG